jgi:hypothetical protein
LQPGGHRFEPGILHQPPLGGVSAPSHGWASELETPPVAKAGGLSPTPREAEADGSREVFDAGADDRARGFGTPEPQGEGGALTTEYSANGSF